MKNYKERYEDLLGRIFGYIDAEMCHTLERCNALERCNVDEYKDRYEINLDDIEKLPREEFAMFGCRVDSFVDILAPHEEYILELDPKLAGNINTLKAIAQYFDQVTKFMKKQRAQQAGE